MVTLYSNLALYIEANGRKKNRLCKNLDLKQILKIVNQKTNLDQTLNQDTIQLKLINQHQSLANVTRRRRSAA